MNNNNERRRKEPPKSVQLLRKVKGGGGEGAAEYYLRRGKIREKVQKEDKFGEKREGEKDKNDKRVCGLRDEGWRRRC